MNSSESKRPNDGDSATATLPPVAQRAKNGDGDSHASHAHGEQGHGGDEHGIPRDLPKPSNGLVILVAGIFVVLLIGLFLLGWFPHHSRDEQAKSDAAEMSSSAPVVNITQPKLSPGSKDLNLPADIRPNQQTAIFTRANGYLDHFGLDIHGKDPKKPLDVGDHVEAGQLLAVIATPDVDAQLAQSIAALDQSQAQVVKAQADVDLAKKTLDRYLDAEKNSTGSVTQLQIDQTESAYKDSVAALASANANVEAARANVQQLKVMQGFENITAPFAGTLTARNYDVGALLSPSSSNSVKEIFDLAQTDLLRVFVYVPQTYATNINMGQPATLAVRNFPGRHFDGIVARSAGALDPATRTIPFELDFANPDGTLYAGMYGQTSLVVNQSKPLLTVPTSALVFNANGKQVALVQDGKIHFQPIEIGRDLGTELEVASGVNPTDQVVSNPGERLAEGIAVTVAPPPQEQKQADAPPKPNGATARAAN